MSAERSDAFRRRQREVQGYLEREGIDLAVLVDLEGVRNPSVRYLCGHPMDAVLFISPGECLLVPWDVNLAEERAAVDRIVPFTRFERRLTRAVREVAAGLAGASRSRRIELSGRLAYPDVRELEESLPDAELVCRHDGVDRFLLRLRSVKDADEADCLRRAADVTNRLLARIEDRLREGGPLPLEVDLALLIEREARLLGAEGTGFETLAASPPRSFGIHPHPACTAAPFGGPGLSILDFGVSWEGYTSDVTVTAVRGPLSRRQEKQVEAVQRAYDLAAGRVGPGVDPTELSRAVDELFQADGFSMPHALGHGVGLEAHEAPYLRARPGGSEGRLEPGMVLTIEPGLYDPEAGGVRLENDLLVTSSGAEVLTNARLLRLDG